MVTVSNEVLAERIEGFTRQVLGDNAQTRKDLTNATDAMGRVQDSVITLAESLNRHQQLEGHPVEMVKVALLEKDASKAKQDIDQLRDLVSLKGKVAQLEIAVTAIEGKQNSQASFRDGQKSALTSAEKIILLCVAASGPLLSIIGSMSK